MLYSEYFLLRCDKMDDGVFSHTLGSSPGPASIQQPLTRPGTSFASINSNRSSSKRVLSLRQNQLCSWLPLMLRQAHTNLVTGGGRKLYVPKQQADLSPHDFLSRISHEGEVGGGRGRYFELYSFALMFCTLSLQTHICPMSSSRLLFVTTKRGYLGAKISAVFVRTGWRCERKTRQPLWPLPIAPYRAPECRISYLHVSRQGNHTHATTKTI